MGASLTLSHDYAERDDAPEPLLDRLFADAAYSVNRWSSRTGEPSQLAKRVSAQIASYADPPQRLPALRHRLRRDGYTEGLSIECLAAYAAIARQRYAPQVFHAALAMLNGRIAEVPARSERLEALAMAAWAQALSGVPVHVHAASEAMSKELAALLAPFAEASGLEVAAIAVSDDARVRRAAYRAAIVCGTTREFGHDYLRDRLAFGARGRTLAGVIERLAAPPGSRSEPLLPGLHCALVAEADVLMIDEAQGPLMLAADAQQPQTRLVHEQALEYARTLAPGVHFTLGTDATRLTLEGRTRLERLVESLGGVWRAEHGREALIEAALDALHRLERDRDYLVERDAVQFPPPHPDAGEDDAEARAVRQRMVEIKEGCRLSGRREILARLPMPRFLRRYVRLAGVCEDASGTPDEFRALYRLRVSRAAKTPRGWDVPVRLFTTAQSRDAALVQAVQAAHVDGATPVVAVRTPKHAQSLAGALTDAGLEPVVASGPAAPAPTQRQVLLLMYPAHRSVDAAPGRDRIHLIVAELHDSERQVQQLCRALEPQSCRLMLSLDDETLAAHLGALLPALRLRYRGSEEVGAGDARRLCRYAQRDAERAHAHARLELISRDQQLSDLLAFSGQRE